MEKAKKSFFKFKIVMHTFQKLSTKLLTMKILEVGGYFSLLIDFTSLRFFFLTHLTHFLFTKFGN